MSRDETAAARPTASPSPAPSRAVAFTRVAALACALGLIVLGVGGELAWARVGHGTLVLKVLPLVAALPGLARLRLYTCRWMCLLVWLYAAEGAVRWRDAPPENVIAAFEFVLSLGLFAACAAQVRLRLAASAQADPEPATSEPAT
jgi:uncharacterized membrane protein